jgi:hypothetical protein
LRWISGANNEKPVLNELTEQIRDLWKGVLRYDGGPRRQEYMRCDVDSMGCDVAYCLALGYVTAEGFGVARLVERKIALG